MTQQAVTTTKITGIPSGIPGLTETEHGWEIAASSTMDDVIGFAHLSNALTQRAYSFQMTIIAFVQDKWGAQAAVEFMGQVGWYSEGSRRQIVSDLAGTIEARKEAERLGVTCGPQLLRTLATARDNPKKQVEIIRGIHDGTIVPSRPAVLAEIRNTDTQTEAAGEALRTIQREFDILLRIGTPQQVEAARKYVTKKERK